LSIALLVCRLLLAALFISAGLAKIADVAGARRAAADFGLPCFLARPVGTLLPVLEVAAAVALVPLPSARFGALAIALLLVSFSAAIGNAMAHGRAPDCHCFGQVHSAPVGWRTLVRNLVLLAAALFVTIAGWHRPGLSATHWLAEISAPWLLTMGAGATLLAMMGFFVWFALQLLAQNGRALSRLEALESSMQALTSSSRADHNDLSHPLPGALGEGLVGAGLPVGSPAPQFSLDVAGGGRLSVSGLLAAGRLLVLVFISAGCGPCEMLLPRLVEWQERFGAWLTIAVVASGQRLDLEGTAAKYGLQRLLVQAEREVAEAYQTHGTPSAVVVSPEGVVLSPTVGGSEQIATLVRQAAAHTTAGLRSREQVTATVTAAAREAVSRLGDPAADVTLTDLDGREAALADFYQGASLLLFWDPGCGFCRRMLPQLQALSKDRPTGSEPQVVVVSTGELAAVREQVIPTRVLHDPGGLAMRAFGAGGTPMGVLVEDGRVASRVVAGADAVLRLLAEAERAGEGANRDRALAAVAGPMGAAPGNGVGTAPRDGVGTAPGKGMGAAGVPGAEP
jgi:thiol-disulfide isomerase/thioredoxin/uncharacterized membrane protein YphA (DoxX/SURF4 family)